MRILLGLFDSLLARIRKRRGEFLVKTITVRKARRGPPAIGGPRRARIGILTPEQIDEAMFG